MRTASWKRHALALTPALLCFAAAIAILHPFANVLYGADDWAYAWSVQRMVLDHRLLASSWVTATTVPQTFWGTLAAKLLGLSFRTLNIATMVISFAGLGFVYLTAIELGLKERYAAVLTFFVALTPNYLSFACSFMSDMYYAVLLLGTVFLYVRGLLRQSRGALLIGAVVASLALMQRQIGVVTPAALVFSSFIGVLTRRRRLKAALLDAAAAALLPALTALGMRAFPGAFGGITHTQEVKMNGAVVLARFEDIGLSIANGYTALVYLAIFSLPLLLACSPALLRSLPRFHSRLQRMAVIAALVVALAALAAALVGHGSLFVDGEFLHSAVLPPSGRALWRVLAFVGSLAFPVLIALVVVRAFSALRKTPAPEAEPMPGELEPADAPLVASFLVLTLLFHWLLVAAWISFFNNYLLPLTPLVALLVGYAVAPELGRSSIRFGWALPALAAALAFASTLVPADLMVRYVEADDKATDALIAQGTPDDRVFGYTGSYPRRHYELADREIEKNPWGMFARLRKRCSLVLLPEGLKRFAPWPRKVSSSTYHTLIGERVIDVWGKAVRAPRHSHAPSPPTPPALPAEGPS